MNNKVVPMLMNPGDNCLDQLHEASLSILLNTGVNVHNPRLRRLLQNAGASVHDDLKVRISSEMVERALSSAPSRIDIYDRDGKVSMKLCGSSYYFGTGSDLEYTIDSGTKERRESTLDDVAKAACICDSLDNIDFIMSYSLANDIHEDHREVKQLCAMMDNSRKPVIMTAFSRGEGLELIHKAAYERCGGVDAFRESPNYILYGQFISPLQHDADALDRLIYCAEQAIPLIYVPTIMLGASGPITLAGGLALANAECLAGLVMHQAVVPGAPFIYGGCISPLDMLTTVFAYGTPEWRLADLVLSQLSQTYKLPVFGTAGATDSKIIDAQAGAEWAYSLLFSAFAGSNLIHDVGYMESGLTGSLEAIVICDEIIGMTRRFLKGFDINEHLLDLDSISRIGPGGHFMTDELTLEHFKDEVWYPSLFDRNRFESWQDKGSKDVVQRARDYIHTVLK